MLKPFFAREEGRLRRIDPAQVKFLSTEKNQTKIFLANGTYFDIRTSLKAAIKILPPDMFIQVHRAYVASIYYIDYISNEELIIDDKSIPIGKMYFIELINKLTIID